MPSRISRAALTIILFLPYIALAEKRLVSITGKAVIEVPADIVRIGFSVESRDIADTKKSKSRVDQVSNGVLAAMYDLGLGEEDITTDGFYLEHSSDYEEECDSSRNPLVGRSFELTLRDLTKYNLVINALVKSGISEINSSTIEVSNRAEIENKAMAKAIENAKSQAALLVEKLDAQLGPVHKIGHRRTNSSPYLEEVIVSGLRRSSNKYEHINFSPAPIKVNASIYIEFEIK